jgi:hypothetical protein
MRRSSAPRRLFLVSAVAVLAGLATGAARAADPGSATLSPIAPPDSLSEIKAKTLVNTPRPQDPVNRANRLILDEDPVGAIAVCKANLKADSSDAPLRAMLGWAYIARDRVCLPLPTTAEEFVKAEEGHLKCAISLVPVSCADTVKTVLAEEARLAPDSLQTGLIALDYLMRFGTAVQVRAKLQDLDKFDRV